MKKMKKRSGQVLILVLLIVVVALSVGLSVASRNITNLRISTQTEQSQRAFSAAEGGVEDVLSNLTTIAGDAAVASPSGKDVPVTVGNITANVNVKSSTVYETLIEEGTVGQVNLDGTSVSQVQVEWGKASLSSEAVDPASVELTVVTGTGGVYTQTRFAFTGGGSGREETGFGSPNCTPSSAFVKCARVSLGSAPKFLRVRPFWKGTTVRVSGVGGNLPTQRYDIVSTAATDLGITRRVQVTRTALPALPAAFDYVLFSEGDIVK